MATLLEERRDGQTSGSANGSFGLAPPKVARGRLPQAVLGAALMVAFALAAVLWHFNAVAKEPAWALAASVKRGQVIDAHDIRLVYLATSDPIAHIKKTDSAVILGHLAATDLSAGTLLTPADVTSAPKVTSGEGVVGMVLDPGQFPSGRLSPGDRVNVIAGEKASSLAGDDGVVAKGATVTAVSDFGQSRKFVSLKAAEHDANRIAAAAQAGALRLVLVGDA